MRTEGNISKVAICPTCGKLMMACHVDYLSNQTEKDFTEFTNEGFIVKIETKDETVNRKYGDYKLCSKKECEPV